MTSALQAHGLGKRYGRRWALSDCTLDVPAGRVVGLVGPNGAGKTTLLRLVAGLLKPTSGDVRVRGVDVRSEPSARASVGLISHHSMLYAPLTARENVEFSARLYGLDDPPAAAATALGTMKLGEHADVPLRTLSRGLQQRASIARAKGTRSEALEAADPSRIFRRLAGVERPPETWDGFWDDVRAGMAAERRRAARRAAALKAAAVVAFVASIVLVGVLGISMVDNVLRPLLLAGRTSASGLVVFLGLLRSDIHADQLVEGPPVHRQTGVAALDERLADLVVGRPGGAEPYVVGQGGVEQEPVLGDQADGSLALGRRHVPEVDAADPHDAGDRVGQADQQLGERRLPRAGLAHDGDGGAGRDAHVDVREDRHAVAVGEGEARQLDVQRPGRQAAPRVGVGHVHRRGQHAEHLAPPGEGDTLYAYATGEVYAATANRETLRAVDRQVNTLQVVAEEVALAVFDPCVVFAIDTKDRYTKRHSEDVARYAVFLAARLGLEPDLRRTIHLAGLLHDVGKIGIPDHLLRKPGKLTADEFDVFKQHVALGDAIVRDIPNVDLVRAGIRHHHERWDGGGYLEGREGDDIPIIARVLAVADAFSAMTTTRPYRKALDVGEALKRLGDAAGGQLEEDLVVAFIAGMETAPDAPMPDERPASIWRPAEWVA